MNKMIEIKNLTKSYNGVKVVDNIGLKVNDGEIFIHVTSLSAMKSFYLAMWMKV